jgi:2-polyprenyl-3-methyl-5-hydroxy-6-metoxy-1,4-benzoquinol methylase
LASIYEVPVDPDAGNNPHAFVLDIVGYNKRVLELGCSSGYVTKALVDRGCDVVGIEVDATAAAAAEKWAQRVVVGDLDAGTLWQELEGEEFDVITLGDVLEHLRDPLATLRAAVRHVKPSGFLAISVPNVAHGDVRIALLQGKFPYGESGLLDSTHVRFFTKSSLQDMIRQAGLLWVETRRVVVPLFETEIAVDEESVEHSTMRLILEDPEAETYQFVIKAVPDNGTQELAALAERVVELSDQVHDEEMRTALVSNELGDLLQVAQRESLASREQLDAVLNTKTFRILSPLRSLYAFFRRQ